MLRVPEILQQLFHLVHVVAHGLQLGLYLFDKQSITEQRKAMVQKLERNQNADGGWNWFSSRYNEKSSRYITQHLLIGSGRLMDKGICKAGDNFLKENTLKKAVAFIDNDVQRDYQEMKKKYPEQLKEEMISLSLSDLSATNGAGIASIR